MTQHPREGQRAQGLTEELWGGPRGSMRLPIDVLTGIRVDAEMRLYNLGERL